MAHLLFKNNDFLDAITDGLKRVLQVYPDKDLIILAGVDFDKRFRHEISMSSGQMVKYIHDYMGVEYEVRKDMNPKEFIIIHRKDYQAKPMIILPGDVH